MNCIELFDKGYEWMGSATNVDDALDIAEEYMKNGTYKDYQIARYKNKVGQEDAYGIFLLTYSA